MKNFIPLIVDTAFSLILSFVISFVLINSFVPKPYSYVFALMIAGLFTLMAFKILYLRKNNRQNKAKKDKEYQNVMTQFAFMSKNDTCAFFKQTLEKCGYKIEKRRSSLRIKDKNVLLVFNFGFDAVSKTDVVKAYNLKTLKDKVYILAETYSPEVKAFANRFENLFLSQGNEIFDFLKKNDCLPQTKYAFKENKFDKIEALKSLLNKKNYKRFALFGIIFLIMSYFVPMKIYYIVVGGIFCTFSLICLLFGKTKNPT